MKRSRFFNAFNHNHPQRRSLDFYFRTFFNTPSQLPSNNYHHHNHLISLIPASKTLKRLLQIHTQLIVSGFTQDNFTNTHLIESYSSFKKINLARLVFNATPNPSVVLWNSMIKAHIRSMQHREAIAMYNKMKNTDSFAVQPDKYTYTFLLKACTHLLDMEEGVSLHEEIVKKGLESDVFIGTGLIDMYCKCGQLDHARQVFDKIPQKDVVVWNAMVAGLSQSTEYSHQAIEVFRSMQLQGGVEPSSVSLLNLYPAIHKLSSLRLCKSIHGFVIKRNFPNTVINGLIDVYSKCKRTDIAYQIFNLMREPDDISWGTLMAGFSLNRCHYEVLQLFDQMQNNHLNINIVSVISALSAAGETNDLKKGKLIHECVKKNKFDSDIRVSTPLITMYAKCGELHKAQDLFSNLSKKDIIAWSAVIAAFTQSGYPEEALDLFREMQFDFNPSQVTIVGVLPACGELCFKKLGKSLHCYTIKHNIDSDTSIETSLVAMYAKCDDFTSAITVFDRMSHKEVVAWNALINRYSQIGETDLAIKMFCKLQSLQLNPDFGTMVGVVSVAAYLGDINLGSNIHGLLIKHGFELDCHVNNALIDMYAKSQSLVSAELLFSLTKIQDQVLWNVMIGAYTRNGYSQDSILTFRLMKSEGFKPSLITFVSILPAVANLSAIKEGASLHADIIRTGFLSHTSAMNSLIDMYSKCGRVDYSETVFKEIKIKDTVSWNVMLAGYAVNGLGDLAFGFFKVMENENVEIDPVSFVSVLSACRHAGLVDEGKLVFCSMKRKHGIEPKMEHYACMVDLLGRAGLFEETLELIESMPMEADAGVWGGLLGACQMHCNVKLGELALENLVKLEAGNQAHYVVLAGIYKECGRWEDARNLWKKMTELGIKKSPGCSWINEEVGGCL